MHVKNLRDHDVEVAPVDLPGFDVKAGEVIEVPDNLGKNLIEQVDGWGEVKAPTKKVAPNDSTTESRE